MTPGWLAERVEYARARALQDALTEATANYWLRRAEIFAAAAPRVGDYFGHATAEQVEERRQRCLDAALACRRHAALLRGGQQEIELDVLAVFAEVA